MPELSPSLNPNLISRPTPHTEPRPSPRHSASPLTPSRPCAAVCTARGRHQARASHLRGVVRRREHRVPEAQQPQSNEPASKHLQHISTLTHSARVHPVRPLRICWAREACSAEVLPTRDRCVYAPWSQKETKEQKTAEAKTEEQETKAEKQTLQVRPTPSPPSPLRKSARPRPATPKAEPGPDTAPTSWPRPCLPDRSFDVDVWPEP